MAQRIHGGAEAPPGHAPRARQFRWATLAWIGGAAIVVSVLAMVPVGVGTGPGTGEHPSRHVTTEPVAASRSATPPSEPSRASLFHACRAQLAAESGPIRRARQAISQWRVHVTAMNKLVAGAITMRQAMRFWANSQAGAKHHVHGFQSAVHRYHRQTRHDACGPPLPRRCQRAQAASAAAVSTAARTISTWQHHIMDMDMLAAGKLSPARANRMWVNKWQRGVFEIVDFRAKSVLAEHQHC
jgi:hypothetical protein